MARTTAEKVKAIIETTQLDATVTDYFIPPANRMVTQVLGGKGLSTAILTDIETWLAAHLLAISVEKQAMKVKIGDAADTYNGKTDMGLNASMYGQMVITLDTTGSFAAIANGKVPVSFKAITSFS